MEGFWIGLDDEIRLVMPQGDSCWMLAKYISFALWVDGSSFAVGEAEEDPATSVRSSSPSISAPETDPTLMPTTDTEPTADRETQPLPAMEIEPKPAKEPAAISVPEDKPEVPADQVCEPAAISMPVGVLVELDTEGWMID
ncbi:hypothetical protein DPX16_17754 [Anabarilius grahami]|uniref:Uncharacterized protein n=1 Tax=Anabarilius grahami TaxID=495550 RepID=A0A3N0YIM4_ANAGA|nr:hypothetical protein DPX16_17754 [Anabarilius grahami]